MTTHRPDAIETYSQEMALVFLDLVSDVFVEEELTKDQGAHGRHIKTLCFCQDILIRCIDNAVFLLLLNMKER